MRISEIEHQCAELNQRQLTCFGISCFGMLSHSAKDFIDSRLSDLKSVWDARGLDLGADFMELIYHELATAFKNGTTSASEKSLSTLDNAFVTREDGSFEESSCLLFGAAYTLGRLSFLSFESDLKNQDVFGEVETTILQGVCHGLFNVAEPYSPHSDEMWQGIRTSTSYLQAAKDIEYAIGLAKQEKILPLGERKWDFEFFGLPFDGSKNRDMFSL